MIQVQAGKSYRMRDRGMAVILARVPEPVKPGSEVWVGAMVSADGEGFESASWFENGKYMQTGAVAPFDLIEEFAK